ncbi:5-oxoprolinase subunit PxpB [Mammaliicoccus sp. Dog046]|uniref:5-oxoprolinase subunit PxpB n=1 Tax=Mammaliicoccus sp. Dog046 TaxID=3034233 RepID=UPI002B25C3CA|nr:5-oxoprolinase subunit PxpB [Mammaliicoccus sp. Dog046]WQK86543.1 5-oxoprolinase subunit PxpB [Mammaliicoccus sp. Dog046]
MEIKPIDETHFMIYEENVIDTEIKSKISSIANLIDSQDHPAIISVTPSYRSIMVTYDVLQITLEVLLDDLGLNNLKHDELNSQQSKRLITIPVAYGGAYGPDLNVVSNHANLSEDEVIKLHTEPNYLIYAIGFLPGFPFLGGLNKQIFTPRKETPRSKIVQGSVGIANNQTGLYPKSSPGGWQIIGRTPIDVFNLDRNPMILYEAGDYIAFKAISNEEFDNIEKEINDGRFDYRQLVGEL